MNTKLHERTIKSFVKRHRKLTTHQQKLFQKYWLQFGIAHPKDFFNTLIAEKLILEIGFGDGNALWQMAQQNPDAIYVGIEVHQPGIAALMQNLLERKINNVKIMHDDAVLILKNNIQDNQLSRVQIFFPDPWHKLKHHKRRLIQPELIDLLHQKLKTGGVMHCATDWQDYAKHMMRILSQHVGFKNQIALNQFADNAANQLRPVTKFEQRGIRLKHDVWDLLFEKLPTS